MTKISAADYRALHAPNKPKPAPARRTLTVNPPSTTTRPPNVAPSAEKPPRYVRSTGASEQRAVRVFHLSAAQEAQLLEFLTTALGAVGAG